MYRPDPGTGLGRNTLDCGFIRSVSVEFCKGAGSRSGVSVRVAAYSGKLVVARSFIRQ